MIFGWLWGRGEYGRSGRWRSVRAKHLEKHPRCEVCGRDKNLEVHHIRPFHKFPELECDPDNLITMCADPCHWVFGHLMCPRWKSWNPSVREDAARWLEKIRHRPFDSE